MEEPQRRRTFYLVVGVVVVMFALYVLLLK